MSFKEVGADRQASVLKPAYLMIISLGILRVLHGQNVEMVFVGGGACGDGKCGEPSIRY